jgi:hypothetical protein
MPREANAQLQVSNMDCLLSRKKGMILPVDMTRSGVFPEPTTESRSENLKFMMGYLDTAVAPALPPV